MTDLEQAQYDLIVFNRPIPQYLKEQARLEALTDQDADDFEAEYYDGVLDEA